jgi:hypothetical protein
MASGHVNRVNRPNTWLHRPMLQNVKKALANSEPSTHGTSRTCLNFRVESAFGWKAEVGSRDSERQLLALSRQSSVDISGGRLGGKRGLRRDGYAREPSGGSAWTSGDWSCRGKLGPGDSWFEAA